MVTTDSLIQSVPRVSVTDMCLESLELAVKEG